MALTKLINIYYKYIGYQAKSIALIKQFYSYKNNKNDTKNNNF